MKKIWKRIATLILAASMTVSMTPDVYAATANGQSKTVVTDQSAGKSLKSRLLTANGEKVDNLSGTVTVIVQVEGDSVLSAEGIADMGISTYHETTKAKSLEQNARSMQKRVQNRIEKKVKNAEFGFSYTDVVNGFSVDIDAKDISKIEAIDGVKAVYISKTHSIEEPLEPENTTSVNIGNCCDMMGVDDMHDMGYTGKGKLVAVIDSELDVNHEMFSGPIQDPKYSKSDIRTILEENEMNVEVSANQVYRKEKIPFAYNYTNGNADVYSSDPDLMHGTHVCGIAVGNGGKDPNGNPFTGVAPDAQLLFFGTPDLSDASCLAALDDASKLEVDVINCSWGLSYGIRNFFDEAMNSLKNAGISVFCAAGNEGRGNPAYGSISTDDLDYASGGDPQYIDSTISVASANVEKRWVTYYELKVDGKTIKYSLQGPENFAEIFGSDEENSKPYEYVDCGYGTENEFPKDVKDKIALIRRGKIPFAYKDANAYAAGAKGIILINDKDDFSFDIQGIENLPAIMVSLSDGNSMINATSKSFTTTPDKKSKEEEYQAGKISNFSSWGTNSSLNLKPDITAPGGQIYSSIPDDDYAIWDGTSMASPHMAGAMALFEAFVENEYGQSNSGTAVPASTDEPINTAVLGNALLMSTAAIAYQDEEGKVPYSPRVQGAGVVNLKAATQTPVYLTGTNNDKCSLSLKDKLTDDFTIKFTAHNLTDEPVTYDSVTLYVMTDGYKQNEDGTYSVADRMEPITFDCAYSDKVEVSAKNETTVQLNVELKKEETSQLMEIFSNGFFVDGYVVLDSSVSSVPKISIPFTGYYGDWTAMPALDDSFWDEPAHIGNYLASGMFCDYTFQESLVMDCCNILGCNLFAEEEYDFDTYNKEAYGGISPNDDFLYDYLCVPVALLRNVKYIDFVIKDKGGKVIAEHEYDKPYHWKYGQNCDDFLLEELPQIEGDYTLTINARLAYERDKEESQTLHFYVDTTAPQITDAQIRQEGDQSYLVLKASDNKYLMGAEIFEEVLEEDLEEEPGEEFEEGFYVSAPFNPAQNGSIKLDVTGKDLSALTVAAYDYACNYVEYNVADLLKEKQQVTGNDDPKQPEATTQPNTTTGQETTAAQQPERVKIKSAKNLKSKSIVVKYKKALNAQKYQICYSTNAKFKKAKTKTTTKLTYTLKKLKKGKTYYIRIRAVNGTLSGKWSKVQKVKVKK